MMRLSILYFFLLTTLLSDTTQHWGERVKGVVYGFESDKNVVALTLDACGGSQRACGFDNTLVEFLIEHNISATLFINTRWIDANPKTFEILSKNPLFEIGNHGTSHKPLSIDGKSIYGILGTGSKEEIIEEVNGSNTIFLKLTGKVPLFFRSGTAYYDEEAVQIVNSQGNEVAGFSINADEGTTLDAQKVAHRVGSAKNGDIIIAHMNRPDKQSSQGIIEGLKRLKAKGIGFVKLSDVKDRLKRY